ncbi:MAG: aminotransferase [Acidimicrobiia bacterium]|nr:aminotransferase [Acidimicrobiia bacterium]
MINHNVRDTMSSPISEAYAWLDGADLDPSTPLIDVSQAVPGYPPSAQLIEHLARQLREPAMSRYGPVLGMPRVRASFAADLNRAYEAEVEAHEVAITAGCNQAFSLAASALCGPGDELVIPVPYYFNHDMWLRIQGIVPRYLECDAGMVPRLDLLDGLVSDRTRAILLITPNNPTGTIYTPDVIHGFYEAARERGIRLILDETYRDFRPTTDQAHGLFGENWQETLIHLYSFSKTFSITGYRAGAMAADAGLLFEIDKIADCIAICPPRAGQEAARFGMEHLASWVEANRLLMNGRVERFESEMARADTGYEIASAGAYFAYVRHPFAGQTGREVARRLLSDHAVLSLAGEMFGPGQEAYLRLAFANLDDQWIPDLVARLAKST